MKMVLFFGFCFFTCWLFMFGGAKKSVLEYFENDYSGLSPKILQMLNETIEKMKLNGLNERAARKNFVLWANSLMVLCAFLGLVCFMGMFLVV